MKNRFRTKKERIMFSVGVIMSTSIPFLTVNRYIVLPFYVTLLICLTGMGLLINVNIIQKRNGYSRCSRKQSDDYLDSVNVDKHSI